MTSESHCDLILSIAPELSAEQANKIVKSILIGDAISDSSVEVDLFLGNFPTTLHPYRLSDPRLCIRALRIHREWLVCHFCPDEIAVTLEDEQAWPAGALHRLLDREILSIPPHRIDRESLEMIAAWNGEMPIVRSIAVEETVLRLAIFCTPEHDALLRYDQGFSIAPMPGKSLIVNGELVKTTVPIFPSDPMKIGTFRGRAFDLIQRIRHQNRTLSLEKIVQRFPDGAFGLQDVSLAVQSGDLVAVMGPSGSGKSTFLDVITGSSFTSGILKAEDFRGKIASVPQDDVLFETLTVEENLSYAGRLRTGLSCDKISARISEILPLIGLEEKRHLRAGSDLDRTLSGGQRRRLSIGLELMGNPHLLILDEPTSGLSGPDAASVVELLRNLARQGTLVIATIHQPSPETFARFDKLIVLDRGGVLAYFGYAAEAAAYFVGTDAVSAEPILGTIMKSSRKPGEVAETRIHDPSHWGEIYQKHKSQVAPPLILNEASDSPSTAALPRSWFSKAATIGHRELARRIKDWGGIFQAFGLATLLGGLIAIVCRQGSPYEFSGNKIVASYAFLAIILTQFLAASAAVGEVVKDRRKQQREKLLEIDGGLYVLAKLPFLYMLSIAQAGIISWTGYELLSIPFGFYPFWLTLSLAGIAATSLGLLISSLPKMTEMKAMSAVPLLLIPQIVLAGAEPFAFQDMKHLHWPFSETSKTPWFTTPIPSRWAYEGAIHAWTDIPGQQELDVAKNDRPTLNFFKKYRKQFLENRAEFEAIYQNKFGKPFDHAAMTRNIAVLSRFGILQPNDVNKTYALEYTKLAPQGADLALAQNTTLTQHANQVVSKSSAPHRNLAAIAIIAAAFALIMNRLALGQSAFPKRRGRHFAKSRRQENLTTDAAEIIVVTDHTFEFLSSHIDLSAESIFRSRDVLPFHSLAFIENGVEISSDAEIRKFDLATLLARVAARRVALPLNRSHAQESLHFTLQVEPEWKSALVSQIEQIGQSLDQHHWTALPPVFHFDEVPQGMVISLKRDSSEISGILRELLHQDLRKNSAFERLARQIHIEYCRVEAADRREENHSPAVGQTWETLDETYRGYSRDSATHLLASAQGLGFQISLEDSSGSRDAELLKALAAHLEELAACEHYRWSASKVLSGWTYGNPRDDKEKRHPDLVAYHSLSESTKEKDRACVRALAVILQRGMIHAS